MRALALAAWLVGCSGGDGQIDALVRLEARPMQDAPCVGACNPTAPLGCARCTYIHRADMQFVACYEWCTDDPGSVPLGDACTPNVGGVDDCVAGSVCRVDTCVPFCSYGSILCPTGFCPPDELVCYAGCDPTAPACHPGEQCTLSRVAGEGPGCAPIGAKPEGAECNYPEECGSGLACVQPDQFFPRCRTMCVLAGPPCATGTCTPMNAGDPYGVCL